MNRACPSPVWFWWVCLAAVLCGGVIAWWVPEPARAQESDIYNHPEAFPCVDPEMGPSHENCVCFVLRVQDSDYYRGQRAEGRTPPFRYPSNLRYEDEDADPIDWENEFVRDKEFKAQCSLTYMREDMRRAWWFAVAVATALLTMSMVWGGFVYMQESAAATDRATSRSIIFRVMAGFAIVVMAYFLYAGFSDLFVNLGETTIWTPDFEDTIRRPDW